MPPKSSQVRIINVDKQIRKGKIISNSVVIQSETEFV